MTDSVRFLITIAAVVVAMGTSVVCPAKRVLVGGKLATVEVENRDKRGTNLVSEKGIGSQAATAEPLTSHVSFTAEGMGLEPTTGFPAPHFQCGR